MLYQLSYTPGTGPRHDTGVLANHKPPGGASVALVGDTRQPLFGQPCRGRIRKVLLHLRERRLCRVPAFQLVVAVTHLQQRIRNLARPRVAVDHDLKLTQGLARSRRSRSATRPASTARCRPAGCPGTSAGFARKLSPPLRSAAPSRARRRPGSCHGRSRRVTGSSPGA